MRFAMGYQELKEFSFQNIFRKINQQNFEK